MLAKRRLHPLHYCFMEVHNQVRSHVCLLPDTSIQGYHEVLWCCHPISQHHSVHKISHGNSWLRECCRYIIVTSWAASSRRDVQQSLLMTCIVKATHLKSSSPPGPTCCRLSTAAVYVCLPQINNYCGWDFFRKVYSQLAPIVSLHSLAVFLPSLSRVYPSSLASTRSLAVCYPILLPHPSNQLWIVTDGSVTKCRLGATI